VHGEIVLTVLLSTLDGRVVVRTRVTGTDPQATGRAAAAELLDRKGGRALLADVLADSVPSSSALSAP
jgi:hypothetical protein